MLLSDDGIKRKVTSGVVVLGIKRVIFQIVITFSSIVLARLLAPKIFGAFAIITFLITLAGIFTNFGLSRALIQKRDSPTKKGLRAIFTALFFSSLAFALLVFFLAPLANVIYRGQLSSSDIYWLRLFSVSLFLTNATAISGSLLEKRLDYKRLAVGELSCLLLTQFLTIFFAMRGLGVGSFVLANIISGSLGFFLYFFLSPWPIGFNFSYSDIKKYLPFGLNYQTNALIGAANGAVIPGFIGAVAGFKAVGLVNWAGSVRGIGLLPSEVIGRLVFSACSRAQTRDKLLKSLIERMIQLSCMLAFPLFAALFALAKPITYLIYTDKWLPGLTALYLSIIQGVFILVGAILIDVLFALGEAKTVRNISLFWAVLQWGLTVPLVLLWNFNGVVLAGVLVSSTFFIPLREVREKVKINFWPHFRPYLIYSILAGLLMFGLGRLIIIDSLIRLFGIGLAGAIFYWGAVWVFKKEEVIGDWARLKGLITSKSARSFLGSLKTPPR